MSGIVDFGSNNTTNVRKKAVGLGLIPVYYRKSSESFARFSVFDKDGNLIHGPFSNIGSFGTNIPNSGAHSPFGIIARDWKKRRWAVVAGAWLNPSYTIKMAIFDDTGTEIPGSPITVASQSSGNQYSLNGAKIVFDGDNYHVFYSGATYVGVKKYDGDGNLLGSNTVSVPWTLGGLEGFIWPHLNPTDISSSRVYMHYYNSNGSVVHVPYDAKSVSFGSLVTVISPGVLGMGIKSKKNPKTLETILVHRKQFNSTVPGSSTVMYVTKIDKNFVSQQTASFSITSSDSYYSFLVELVLSKDYTKAIVVTGGDASATSLRIYLVDISGTSPSLLDTKNITADSSRYWARMIRISDDIFRLYYYRAGQTRYQDYQLSGSLLNLYGTETNFNSELDNLISSNNPIMCFGVDFGSSNAVADTLTDF